MNHTIQILRIKLIKKFKSYCHKIKSDRYFKMITLNQIKI